MNIRPYAEPLWVDVSIADRLDQIEKALKFDPDPAYRRELIREYLDLTTDPDEEANWKEQPNG
jgi:hypothetical protein